jgi:prepilin-type N-terminal cleavage/methylation domain-containing protein
VTSDRGFSLVETIVGMSVLLVVTVGVLPLSILTLRISENQGHLAARCSEYAQDKLEQLMVLSFGDTITDTRTFPANAVGGSGLSPGGSIDPDAPVATYVDYLNIDGVLLESPDGAPPDGWFYQRLWRVQEVGPADVGNCPLPVSATQICLKRVTVTATVQQGAAGASRPSVTVAALKTYPF